MRSHSSTAAASDRRQRRQREHRSAPGPCRPAHPWRADAGPGSGPDTSTASLRDRIDRAEQAGQHRHHDQEAHVGLRLLERARERGQVGLDRRRTAGTAAAPRRAAPTTCCGPSRKRMPRSCSGIIRSSIRHSVVVMRDAERWPRRAAASHLPPAMAVRGAGFTSSGSSEPRSRSPAVESVAICIPPVNAASTMNSGMKLRMTAARCWALETSRSSMRMRRDHRGAHAARRSTAARRLRRCSAAAGRARAAPSGARPSASRRRSRCSSTGRDARNFLA